jgi:hypothetical protein
MVHLLRHVLIVGADVSVLQGIAPMLRREEFELHTAPASEMVLDLILSTSFELMVVTYPLAGVAIEDLLGAVRGEGSGCLHAGVILLTRGDQVDQAHAWVDRGANRAIGLDWAPARMWQAFADLLSVAPRISVRFPVHLAITVEDGQSVITGHTANLSSSGMLLSGPVVLTPGSRFKFMFAVPEQTRPIRGTGEVVRRAREGADDEWAYGVRFMGFRDDDLDRLVSYLTPRVGAPG